MKRGAETGDYIYLRSQYLCSLSDYNGQTIWSFTDHNKRWTSYHFDVEVRIFLTILKEALHMRRINFVFFFIDWAENKCSI